MEDLNKLKNIEVEINSKNKRELQKRRSNVFGGGFR